MRVLLAGLFVFGVTLGTVYVIGQRYPDDKHLPSWATPAIIGAMFASIVASLFLFNRRDSLSKECGEDFIARLEKQNLLVTESFEARRAFQVEEFEDEGSHYFIELNDRRVLFLTGQYLYDDEPADEEEEKKKLRQFPCTRFTVRRHKSEGYVVDLACSGQVLQPECLAPSFNERDCEEGIPADGQIISDRSYDELKRERLGQPG